MSYPQGNFVIRKISANSLSIQIISDRIQKILKTRQTVIDIGGEIETPKIPELIPCIYLVLWEKRLAYGEEKDQRKSIGPDAFYRHQGKVHQSPSHTSFTYVYKLNKIATSREFDKQDTFQASFLDIKLPKFKGFNPPI